MIIREFKFRIYLWKMKGEMSGSEKEKLLRAQGTAHRFVFIFQGIMDEWNDGK